MGTAKITTDKGGRVVDKVLVEKTTVQGTTLRGCYLVREQFVCRDQNRGPCWLARKKTEVTEQAEGATVGF